MQNEKERRIHKILQVKDAFTCPITQELMNVPVIISSGHTFDKEAIDEWFKTNNTCPLTRQVLLEKAYTINHHLRGQISDYKEKTIKKSIDVANEIIEGFETAYYTKCKQVLEVARTYNAYNPKVNSLYIRIKILLGESAASDITRLLDYLHDKQSIEKQTELMTFVKSTPTMNLGALIDELIYEFNLSKYNLQHLTLLDTILSPIDNKLSTKVVMELVNHQKNDQEKARLMYTALDRDPEDEAIYEQAMTFFRENNRLADILTFSFRRIQQQPSTLIDNMQTMLLSMVETIETQKRNYESQLDQLRQKVNRIQSSVTQQSSGNSSCDQNEKYEDKLIDLEDQLERIQRQVFEQQNKNITEMDILRERLKFTEQSALPMHKHFEYQSKMVSMELKKKILKQIQPFTRCKSIIPTGDAIFCTISLKRTLVATCHPDKGEICVWDTVDANPVKSFGKHVSDLKSVWEICSAGPTHIVCASLLVGGLKIFDWEKGTLVNNIPYSTPVVGYGHSVLLVFGPSYHYCAAGLADKTVTIFDIAKIGGEVVKVLKGHSAAVTCLQTLCNNHLASGSADKSIKIWSLETGKCLQTLTGHTNIVTSMCMVNIDILASASQDTTIKLWNDLNTKPVCIRTLTGHTGFITTIITLGMNCLASGSIDKTIRLWDVKNGTCLSILSGHSSNILCITWCKGYLVSCDDQQQLRIWTA